MGVLRMNKKELEGMMSMQEWKSKRREFINSFQTQVCQWEINRADRLETEEQFEHFTGHLDIVELHIPYTIWGYVFDMMEETRLLYPKEEKILVLAGDSLNLDMMSVFYQRSTDRSKPSDEWRDLIKFLRIAEKIYDHIIFMETNHDNRIWKMLMKTIVAKEIYDEVMKWMLSYRDAFNNEKFTKILTIRGAIFQIGDVLITHFENQSSVPGHISRDVIKFLLPRIEKDWNVVFQAHTHCQSKIPNDRKICIETGALCGVLDYWRRGKMKGKGKLTSVGYAVCDMIDGVADPNRSNFVFKGWEDWL